jgi:hypothetical protein
MWERRPHGFIEMDTASSKSEKFLERHSLSVGVALMFALTWPFYARLGLFVGYGLALAALVMTGLTQRSAGVRALLGRFVIWRVDLRWYLVVLLVPPLLDLTAIGLYAWWRG